MARPWGLLSRVNMGLLEIRPPPFARGHEGVLLCHRDVATGSGVISLARGVFLSWPLYGVVKFTSATPTYVRVLCLRQQV